MIERLGKFYDSPECPDYEWGDGWWVVRNLRRPTRYLVKSPSGSIRDETAPAGARFGDYQDVLVRRFDTEGEAVGEAARLEHVGSVLGS